MRGTFISGFPGEKIKAPREKKDQGYGIPQGKKKVTSYVIGNTRKKQASCDRIRCSEVLRCISAGTGIDISPDGVITATGESEVTCEAVIDCVEDAEGIVLNAPVINDAIISYDNTVS